MTYTHRFLSFPWEDPWGQVRVRQYIAAGWVIYSAQREGETLKLDLCKAECAPACPVCRERQNPSA